MSYDYKAIQNCDHTFFEYFSLRTDNTIHIPWPAINTNSCKVYFHRKPVPSGDYYFRNARVQEIDNTFVIFKGYRRSLDTTYRLALTVSKPQCPKCNGTGVATWLAAKKGGVIDVLDSSKQEHLYQQFMLFLKTKEGSDPFYPNFGSRLHQMVGAISGAVNVSAEIQRVFEQWLSVRQSYDQVIGNTQQTYFSITGSKMIVNVADPRKVQVTVALTNNGKNLTLSV